MIGAGEESSGDLYVRAAVFEPVEEGGFRAVAFRLNVKVVLPRPILQRAAVQRFHVVPVARDDLQSFRQSARAVAHGK